jgi:sensor histidine kinase YesM
MHPILSDKKTLALYLAVWFVVGSLIELPYILAHTDQGFGGLLVDIPFEIFYALVCLSSYYLCRFFPLRSTQWYRLVLIFIFAACCAAGFAMVIGYGWVHFIDSFKITSDVASLYVPWLAGIYSTLVLLFLLVATIHYVIIAFEQTREAERQSYEMKLFAQDAELRALRAQINPHFLFNSLNSISALTGNNPAQARTMTLKLAEFFRQGLKLGAEDFISLRDELSLITNFLEIEKIRFGPRLNAIQEIDPETLDAEVPPLILQPLVENAVRHGVAQMIDGGTVRVSSARVGKSVRILIENPVDPDRSRKKGVGVGLRNVRARLDTLYNSNARVDVEETNDYFRVELLFPLNHR